MLGPGTRVAGYVIEEQVGTGGMAMVYRARDDVLGRLVAVKVLSPALAKDEEFRARFLRESRAVAAVDEPHIVPVYGAGEDDGLLYIATRFVAGGDLSRLRRAAGGRLAPGRAAGLVARVAGALDAAHYIGLVHRDVKPGNILVESAPRRPEHAYLSDFGLSKSTSATSGLTATGKFMGTPDYSSPEHGKTVYVPRGPKGAAKLWDRTTGAYVTPAGRQWPKLDNGITFSNDSRFVITSPDFSSDVVDTWGIATRAHVATVTVPGSANRELLSVAPGAGEILATGSLDAGAGTFSELSIWQIP